MPKVAFYILNQAEHMVRLQFACRFIEKNYAKQAIYIHTPSLSEANRLDQLLWTYQEDSFIPHGLSHPENIAMPVQIGYETPTQDHRDILINLSDDMPCFYQQFSRIIEIVSENKTVQTAARARFRLYREAACEIETHKV